MDIEDEKSAFGERERGKSTNTVMAEPIMLQSLGGAHALGGVPVEHRPHEGQALRRHSAPDAVIQGRLFLNHRLHYLHQTGVN